MSLYGLLLEAYRADCDAHGIAPDNFEVAPSDAAAAETVASRYFTECCGAFIGLTNVPCSCPRPKAATRDPLDCEHHDTESVGGHDVCCACLTNVCDCCKGADQ